MVSLWLFVLRKCIPFGLQVHDKVHNVLLSKDRGDLLRVLLRVRYWF